VLYQCFSIVAVFVAATNAAVVSVISPELHVALIGWRSDVFLCSAGANPFDDEDDEEEDFSNVVGVPVEAMYDYVGQEDDELSFKQGTPVQNCTVKIYFS